MERLHKFMAHCGIASRRQAEDYIRAGRVMVNGEIVTELGVKIDPEKDVVTVDGKTLQTEKKVCYLLHKPKGYATTVDDDLGRRTVLDLLPEVKERIYPAGRLDFDSEGLIVLTNDGDAAYFLTHPSFGVRKVYEAVVEGEVEDSTISTLLEKGVYLGAMRIKPIMAKIVKRQNDSTVVRVIVAEGINREVRRLFAALGHEVKRLVRLEVGPFRIDGIARGQYRLATPQEIAALHESMEAASQHKTGSAKRSSPKHGPTTSIVRPGKPDPALYVKGVRVRRAPLVLNKKRIPHDKTDATKTESKDFRRPSGDMNDVSYETFERPYRQAKFNHIKNKNFQRKNQNPKERYTISQKKEKHWREFDQPKNDGFHRQSDNRKHTNDMRNNDDNRYSHFQRPLSRFSNRNSNRKFDGDIRQERISGEKHYSSKSPRDVASPKTRNHQSGFKNDFQSSKPRPHGRGKTPSQGLNHHDQQGMNERRKQGKAKSSRHPLDRKY